MQHSCLLTLAKQCFAILFCLTNQITINYSLTYLFMSKQCSNFIHIMFPDDFAENIRNSLSQFDRI